MKRRARRAQFSFEALLLAAAYFAFIALLVSAVAGQAKTAVDSEGPACRVLHGVVQAHVAADFSGTGLNFSGCSAQVSAGGRVSAAPADWR